MNPFERKVVHDAISAIDGVHSESEGEEPNRRVVVLTEQRCSAEASARGAGRTADVPAVRRGRLRRRDLPLAMRFADLLADRRRRPRPDRTARAAPALGSAPAQLRRARPSCFRSGARVVDVGTGAGLPGLVAGDAPAGPARRPGRVAAAPGRRSSTEAVDRLGAGGRGAGRARPRRGRRRRRRSRRCGVGDRPRGGAAGPIGEMVPAAAATRRDAARR